MGSLLQDIRYGLRMLARNPAFSAIAMLTLALGIGANTAIFSLTDQILLRRLPVRSPEQLVSLRTTGSNQGHVWSDSVDDSGMFSYPVYKDLRDRNQAFSNLLARFPTSVSVSGQGSTELAQAELVSGNYFEMLGVQPALGRVFSASDETAPGANTLAVLSYGYWARHFGSDPGILNKQIVVNGTSLTVVGVARAGFTGIQIGQLPDLFIPITMKAQMTPGWNGLDDRKDYWIAVLGRLKPGFNRAKAQVALAPTYHAILESDVHLIEGTEKSRQKFLEKKLLVDPASNGRQIVQQGTGKPLLILTAMVALVLLIACVNLASLLVARGEARQREIAVRLTMGASRWRLVKQLLTESLMLSIAGGAAGLALAAWTLSALVGSIPKSEGIFGLEATLDYRVLGFAIALTIVTGVLFGLAPALRATHTDLQGTLKDQGANVSGGTANVRLRKWLLVSQVALTVILLAGGGIFHEEPAEPEKSGSGIAHRPRAAVCRVTGPESVFAGTNGCAREKDSRSGGCAAGRSLGERFANGAFLPGTARVRTWWRKVTFRRNRKTRTSTRIGLEKVISRRWEFRCYPAANSPPATRRRAPKWRSSAKELRGDFSAAAIRWACTSESERNRIRTIRTLKLWDS